jgi:hypothetical protein
LPLSLSHNIDIWSVPIDTDRVAATAAAERLTADLSPETYASISLDGRRLAYIASRLGRWEVRRRDLESGSETVLASSESPLMLARISADGETITYCERAGEKWSVYIVERSGVAQKFCDDCGPPADVSPDGKWIILEPADALIVADAVSGAQRPLVQPRDRHDGLTYSALHSSRFSPEGQWLSFIAAVDRSTEPRLFVVPFRPAEEQPASGNPPQWVHIMDSPNAEAAWSPDGNTLYFLSDRDGFLCAWAQRIAPDTKRPVGAPSGVQHFHHARLSVNATVLAGASGLSAGRGRIVYAAGELTGNIWIARPESRSE